jgi:hypothetical protein
MDTLFSEPHTATERLVERKIFTFVLAALILAVMNPISPGDLL